MKTSIKPQNKGTYIVKTSIHCRVAAVLLVEGILSSAAFSQNVYHLDASTTAGADLTGYDSGSMYGPVNANIEFSGPLVGAAGTVASPFEYIGMGKQTTVTADNSGFHVLPLKLRNGDDVTATSTLKFNAYTTFGSGTLDIGAHNGMTFGYASNGKPQLAYETASIHDGGTLVSPYHLYLGQDVSANIAVVADGTIKAGSTHELHIVRQTAATHASRLTAFVGITNATVSAGSKIALMVGALGQNAANDDPANCRIVLGVGGAMQTKQIWHGGGGGTEIAFDGGRVRSPDDVVDAALFYVDGQAIKTDGTSGSSWPNPKIWLTGVNGNPVDVEIEHDRVLAGGRGGNLRTVNVTGSGGFTKRGAGTLFFNRIGEAVCDYTGPTAILGGGIVVSNNSFKVGRGDLSIAEGAFLNLNGFDAEFAGATGGGIVTNGAAAATLTLGCDGADAAFSVGVGERIDVVKTGAGTLTVSGAALANACNLTVAAGKVVFTGNSTTFGTVTVAAGATLDTTGIRFTCANLVRMPGATILPPEATVLTVR